MPAFSCATLEIEVEDSIAIDPCPNDPFPSGNCDEHWERAPGSSDLRVQASLTNRAVIVAARLKPTAITFPSQSAAQLSLSLPGTMVVPRAAAGLPMK